MGRFTFRLPDIGEGIAEAEIVEWHVAVGDRIEEDAHLVDMMTGKATVEMESPVAGTVLEVAGQPGDKVAIGAPLVVLEVEGEGGEPSPVPAGSLPDAKSVSPPASPSPPARAETITPPVRSPAMQGKALAPPAVRARANALSIDLSTVPAGPDGRVTHAALDAFLLLRAPVGKAVGRAVEKPVEKHPVELLEGAGEQVRIIGLRRRIAEQMAASKRNIAHFTYVEECDVTALETLREELNATRGDGPKLSPLPFLVMAACRALPEFPMINARFDDEAGVVTRYDSVHMGIATQTPAGLVVPVIRNAQALGIRAVAAEIARLSSAARDGSARPEELTGSTITITSLGPLGGIAATPVINRPEVAILGPNRIIERPMFEPDGAGGERIGMRKLMNISISCDHRVVDGWDAASFVQAVKRLLESPLAILAG